MQEKYKPNEIAAYLETHERAAELAARRAGKAIAAAWNDREFWWSVTAVPLEKCAADSPEMTRPAAELVDRLARYFDTHIHNVADWEPAR
jgi:hypothetical protein